MGDDDSTPDLFLLFFAVRKCPRDRHFGFCDLGEQDGNDYLREFTEGPSQILDQFLLLFTQDEYGIYIFFSCYISLRGPACNNTKVFP